MCATELGSQHILLSKLPWVQERAIHHFSRPVDTNLNRRFWGSRRMLASPVYILRCGRDISGPFLALHSWAVPGAPRCPFLWVRISAFFMQSKPQICSSTAVGSWPVLGPNSCPILLRILHSVLFSGSFLLYWHIFSKKVNIYVWTPCFLRWKNWLAKGCMWLSGVLQPLQAGVGVQTLFSQQIVNGSY